MLYAIGVGANGVNIDEQKKSESEKIPPKSGGSH
jgi:hypothetical protein